MFNRRMRQQHPSDGSRGMRSPGLWLGAMVAVVAMGFAALVNLGGAASGSTIMKPKESESMSQSGSMSASGSMSSSGNISVWICHYAGGKYNEQEVADDGAYDGHIGHENDIIPRPAGGCPGDESSGPPTSPARRPSHPPRVWWSSRRPSRHCRPPCRPVVAVRHQVACRSGHCSRSPQR